MIGRVLTLGMVSASLLAVASFGNSAVAASKCMEAVKPKCTATQTLMCDKWSTKACKPCLKWSCTTTKKILPFLM